MRFLKHIRSRSKIKDELPQDLYIPTAHYGPDRISSLPLNVLKQIFQRVCPETTDESLSSLEESLYDGCLLCDVRDLAACAGVSRRWQDVAQDMLYKHITIDAVHYCELELELAEKRKRKKLNRNAEPFDPPKVRLQLFSRTVRENERLATLVESLRLPYMTREACKAELARTVSVLHNLRYVDLPEGFFNDDPSCNVLKQELQASCPEIRRMRYGPGSERSFVNLSQNRVWQNMEIMELAGIHAEPADLLYVLGSFPVLQELKLVDMPWLEDSVFRPDNGLPNFPPIQRLTFSSTPGVHAAGLATYLAQPQNREALTELNLSQTGVQPHHLYLIVSKAPYLEKLSISENIERSMPTDPPTPPLSSSSLKTLHFQIMSHNTARHNIHPPTSFYYSYLASSILTNSLPALTDLFVRDPQFPEILLLAPPNPSSHHQRSVSHHTPKSTMLSPPTSPHYPPQQNNFLSPPTSPSFAPPQTRALVQPLSIYTKGQDELEWNFTSFTRPSPQSQSRTQRSATRPISLMGAESLSPAWGGPARKSVVVGNGLGGFLAVPAEELPRRPGSSSSHKGGISGGGGGLGGWGSIGASNADDGGGAGGGGTWSDMTGAQGQGLADRTRKERKDLWR